MKLAGILSIILAVLLLGDAASQSIDDSKHSAENITTGFAAIQAGDYAGVDRQIAEHREQTNHEEIEGVIGAFFLIMGIALVRFPTKKDAPVATGTRDRGDS